MMEAGAAAAMFGWASPTVDGEDVLLYAARNSLLVVVRISKKFSETRPAMLIQLSETKSFDA